jgi:hypothetical protein
VHVVGAQRTSVQGGEAEFMRDLELGWLLPMSRPGMCCINGCLKCVVFACIVCVCV